jgi:hypothetical protein
LNSGGDSINLKLRTLGISVLFALVLTLIPLAYAAHGGVLYVYTDAAHTTEAPSQSGGNHAYLTNIGGTYYIRIWGITQFNTGDKITVKIGTTTFYNVLVQDSSGTRYADITWTVPANSEFGTTVNVKYRGETGPEYVVGGQMSNVGHMHIVPEVLQGTVGMTVALIAAYSIYQIARRRTRPKPNQTRHAQPKTSW